MDELDEQIIKALIQMKKDGFVTWDGDELTDLTLIRLTKKGEDIAETQAKSDLPLLIIK